MLRKNNSSFIDDDDEDNNPMSSLVNMVDIMLVLAVGFLILAITSTGVMDVSKESPNPQQTTAQSEMVNVTQGTEIPNEIEQGDSSGSGYSRVGSVYKDPETGKLVMIDN